jgi:hypothetical protein
MKAWRKEKTACREATETSLEKEKANPEKKAGLEAMKAAVEAGLEGMKARMNVFEEELDKMDAAGSV